MIAVSAALEELNRCVVQHQDNRLCGIVCAALHRTRPSALLARRCRRDPTAQWMRRFACCLPRCHNKLHNMPQVDTSCDCIGHLLQKLHVTPFCTTCIVVVLLLLSMSALQATTISRSCCHITMSCIQTIAAQQPHPCHKFQPCVNLAFITIVSTHHNCNEVS